MDCNYTLPIYLAQQTEFRLVCQNNRGSVKTIQIWFGLKRSRKRLLKLFELEFEPENKIWLIERFQKVISVCGKSHTALKLYTSHTEKSY